MTAAQIRMRRVVSSSASQTSSKKVIAGFSVGLFEPNLSKTHVVVLESTEEEAMPSALDVFKAFSSHSVPPTVLSFP